MRNTNLKFLILIFLVMFGLHLVSAYTPAPSSTSANSKPPMDNSTVLNTKYAGLGVKSFVSGTSGLVVVDSIGNMGVNTTKPANDVRLYINGTVKIDSLAGSGTRSLCASNVGSSTDGYPIVVCP